MSYLYNDQDVFQKWFRIPEYQRPYVWGSDQLIELLDDVYQARNSNPDSQYFLGSMVLKKTDNNDGKSNYEEYDLLDGQQRLTTLFLITSVIRDLTPVTNSSRIETCRKTIYQMANPDDNIPERLRIVFDIRDKVKDFVNSYIKEEGGTARVQELQQFAGRKDEDISIKNMANAILTIRDYFSNGHSIDEFFPYLRSNVLMIYVAAEELEDAFHLFTVMNNRGIKLRNSDILKAENLAKVKDAAERTNYAKKWESIEEYFGEDFDNFLSHLRTVLVKQKAGYNLLKEFEENIYAPREFDRINKTYHSKPALLEKGKNTFEFIDTYYKHYNYLFDQDHYTLFNSFELNNYLTLMKEGLEADYWVAALLHFYNKFKTNQLLEFVKALDNKFSCDWIVGLSPTLRIENVNSIIKKIDDAQTPQDVISSSEMSVNTADLKRILTGGIYGRRYARYLLLKLDLLYLGHTTKFSPPQMISIEHILPQNPDLSSQWVKNFTPDQRSEWTDKLGNLVLISRRKNTAQSNLDFDKKKEKYFKKNIELFSNSIRIYKQYNSWLPADLKKNHDEVIDKILRSYA
ncbi:MULTISPECIES: DUF262 domain-containing protein [unclassified Paenibacillus]|uniref:DUF262 domain-containing protein n=1 Tax=unclassified Paenibacillus TaxID=185978 RepID=UPI001AE257F9|nr:MULTISPECIES: DUF262 domain-containing protein [unclassified Paenibacillus]MBP1170618.1 uncharacterized protein with ParB-like and HNH nuclease domain [Paenibacillus sp. PvR098]MBP2441646.1 uncharacterized protein with ParB-like and HNH nuclease domain [Paenibacillus sp. PvP052]